MKTEVVVRVNDLAASQWGLLTSAQAQAEGVTRMQLTRLVESGILDRLEHGVYATPSVQGDPLLSLRSSWLTLRPSARAEERLADLTSAGVVSHASAAQLHGIGDLLADEHEFLLPERFQSRRTGVRVRRTLLGRSEVTLSSGLPVTTAARTISDLLDDGHDLDHMASLTAEALRRGLVDRQSLAPALDHVAPRRGSRDGQELTARLIDLSDMPPAELTSAETTRRPSGHAIPDDILTILRTLSDPELQRMAKEVQQSTAKITAGVFTASDGLSVALEPSHQAVQRLSERVSRWAEVPSNRDAIARLRDVLGTFVVASGGRAGGVSEGTSADGSSVEAAARPTGSR